MIQHFGGPEYPWNNPFSGYEISQGMTEKERQEFQTKVLLNYFQQLNRGQAVVVEGKRVAEDELVGELRQGILAGLLQVKWLKDFPSPYIAIADANEPPFVAATAPQELFDLFAPDCSYYREMTNTIFEELRDWAAGRLGALLGLEADGSLVTKMSLEQQMSVFGAVGELIRLMYEKQRELLARLR